MASSVCGGLIVPAAKDSRPLPNWPRWCRPCWTSMPAVKHEHATLQTEDRVCRHHWNTGNFTGRAAPSTQPECD